MYMSRKHLLPSVTMFRELTKVLTTRHTNVRLNYTLKSVIYGYIHCWRGPADPSFDNRRPFANTGDTTDVDDDSP